MADKSKQSINKANNKSYYSDCLYSYHNFSQTPDDGSHKVLTRSDVSEADMRVLKLPAKLNIILSSPEYSHIICWMPHGRSWKVQDPDAFVNEIMPNFFEYSNYNSFMRLVNAWGFRRITKANSPDKKSYYHELFLRGLPHLQGRMRRQTKNSKKLPMNKDDEPNFYVISSKYPLPELKASDSPTENIGMNLSRTCPQAIINSSFKKNDIEIALSQRKYIQPETVAKTQSRSKCIIESFLEAQIHKNIVLHSPQYLQLLSQCSMLRKFQINMMVNELIKEKLNHDLVTYCQRVSIRKNMMRNASA